MGAKYNLGRKAKDEITGLGGIIIGFATYLDGNDEYLIAPPVDSDGKHVDSRWYNVKRIALINGDDSPKTGFCKSAT